MGHIAPYPANNPKNQNFEKWKNPWWYHHFTQVYQNSWSFAIPFTRYGACCLQLFSIYAPNSPKNLNLTKKKKKMPGDIILHKCNKNHDHMLYCSWDMACDVCNCYFSIWDIFFTFTKKQPQKSKWKKKIEKKLLKISSFYTCTKNYDQMMPDIWCATDGWTDGWTDGQKDGQTDGRTE